jgi:hypothetical protein
MAISKGLQGFGYKGKNSSARIPDKPSRNFDLVLTEKSFKGQAFLYRLNGDRNPLHIDPKISALLKY